MNTSEYIEMFDSQSEAAENVLYFYPDTESAYLSADVLEILNQTASDFFGNEITPEIIRWACNECKTCHNESFNIY